MTSFKDLEKDSAWPPSTNGMPPLGEGYPDTLLTQYIAATGELDSDFHSFTVNLSRLADKSCAGVSLVRRATSDAEGAT